MKQNILMRIDFQNDFVHPHGALSLNNPELIEKQQKFADNLFLKKFDKIYDSYDTHFSDTYHQTIEAQNYPQHCIFESWGWQQAAPFNPELEVTPIYKSTTNIWNESHTYSDLSEKDWRNKNVYLFGVLSDVCVAQALDGLLRRQAHVIIIEDLCQGANKQITDIVKEDKYQPFIKNGLLKVVNSEQLFRQILLENKRDFNLVKKGLGEEL